MATSAKAKPRAKASERPATGRDPLMGFRATPRMRAAIVKWAEQQPDMPELPQAVRRLVELGLKSAKAVRGQKTSDSSSARDLAATQLDRLVDTAAAPDEQAKRKRSLLKGPEEFRESRVDRPKARV
jgi:hypothetical protein